MASPTTQSNLPPFGAPAVLCRTLVTEVPLTAAVPATDLHRQTRQTGRVLFAIGGSEPSNGDPATGAQGSGDAITIVVTRAVLRLVVRGAILRITVLAPCAVELLAALRQRLASAREVQGGLEVTVPTTSTADGTLDRDVLRQPSLFDPVRTVAGLVGDHQEGELPPGLFGAFGFDLIDRFEALGPRRPDAFDDADLELVLGLDTVCYRKLAGTARIVTRGLPSESMAAVRERHAATVRSTRGEGIHRVAQPTAQAHPVASPAEPKDAEFLAAVRTLREHIAAGDIFQAVLSRAISWQHQADPLDVFVALHAREPAPYAFHLELERGALFGSSPETCLRVEHGCVEVRPIAGTAPRGVDRDSDGRLALALLFDQKERAEHVMLLDLARNDVARVAVPGSTEVVQQFAIEKYSRVQHMVSRVRGQLRAGLDALHAYRAVANMGTLTGAPKPRAIELIRALEPAGRGFYGGAVGYLLADGRFDSCITIRSMRVVDGCFRAQAGAGIVWHSDPACELAETERKLQALREVMANVATSAMPAEVQR